MDKKRQLERAKNELSRLIKNRENFEREQNRSTQDLELTKREVESIKAQLAREQAKYDNAVENLNKIQETLTKINKELQNAMREEQEKNNEISQITSMLTE